MSFFHYSQPMAQAEFRDATARSEAMTGVTVPTFVCRCCGQRRTIAGRKQITPRYRQDGYRCAVCQQQPNLAAPGAEAGQVPAEGKK